MTRRKIYLASAYSFLTHWKRLLLTEFTASLEMPGLQVLDLFEGKGQVDPAAPGWTYRVAQHNLQDVSDADAL